MDLKKKDIIFFILIGILFYKLFFNYEKMSNFATESYVGRAVTQKYNFDVAAIRNLGNIAKDLTKNNKLVLPGGLTVGGQLEVGGNTTIGKDLTVAGTNTNVNLLKATYIYSEGHIYSKGNISADKNINNAKWSQYKLSPTIKY